MSKNAKISIALVAAVVVIAGVAALFFAGGDDPSGDPGSTTESTTVDGPTAVSVAPDDERLVRPESQLLSNGPDATFVEFLDFACEACGALFPTVEQLRATYGDRVTFAVRYLPLHASSIDAVRAAEAAAAQGKFEEMYIKLFETQAEWGESENPERGRFFGYAEQLGLNMAEFEQVYDSPETTAVIEQSQADAKSLGLTGTPSLFMDGQQLRPQTVQDLVTAFDAAIAN